MASNTVKCRLRYVTEYMRDHHCEPTTIEYEVEATAADVNIITMIGCGVLFCDGQSLEEGMEIAFDVKSGKKWKTVAHWEAGLDKGDN